MSMYALPRPRGLTPAPKRMHTVASRVFFSAIDRHLDEIVPGTVQTYLIDQPDGRCAFGWMARSRDGRDIGDCFEAAAFSGAPEKDRRYHMRTVCSEIEKKVAKHRGDAIGSLRVASSEMEEGE